MYHECMYIHAYVIPYMYIIVYYVYGILHILLFSVLFMGCNCLLPISLWVGCNCLLPDKQNGRSPFCFVLTKI